MNLSSDNFGREDCLKEVQEKVFTLKPVNLYDSHTEFESGFTNRYKCKP